MLQPLLYPNVADQDKEKVEGLLGAIQERLGFVPDALRLYSISPSLLQLFLGNIGYYSTESALGQRLGAMIRYIVSYRSDCSYCIDMNEGFLTSMGLDLDAVRAARDDLEVAPVEANEMPLLRLAVKSVFAPDDVTAADLDACRAAGWDDRAIFDAVVAATSNRAFNMLLRTFKIEHQGAFAA